MSTQPSLSVAMATFNGERFLEEQLDSIARQTCVPDELVVCDDASEDATTDIIRAFAERAPFPVRLCVNRRRLGTSKNFEKAIGLCESELIALSDQDDIWLPEKLERSAAPFKDRPHLGLVFANTRVVFEHSNVGEQLIWDKKGLSRGQRRLMHRGRAFDLLVRDNDLITGMTVVFHARHRSLCLPIPDYGLGDPRTSPRSSIPHDNWLALLISAVAEIDFVDSPLVWYRQHDSNQIGSRPRRLKIPRLKPAVRYAHRLLLLEEAERRLRERGVIADRDRKAVILKRFAAHIRARHKALEEQSILFGVGRLLLEALSMRYYWCNRKGLRKLRKDLRHRCWPSSA